MSQGCKLPSLTRGPHATVNEYGHRNARVDSFAAHGRFHAAHFPSRAHIFLQFIIIVVVKKLYIFLPSYRSQRWQIHVKFLPLLFPVLEIFPQTHFGLLKPHHHLSVSRVCFWGKLMDKLTSHAVGDHRKYPSRFIDEQLRNLCGPFEFRVWMQR